MPDFRIANVFDATAADGSAAMSADRERIASDDEIERLLGYLTGAPLSLYVPSRDLDRVQPARRRVVPMSFRTDGMWIWSEAVGYYLATYAYAPEPALRDHIASRDYQLPAVPRDLLLAAGRVFDAP
jgi:hypothetical protein